MRPLLLAAVGFAAALMLSETIGAYALIVVGACALFALSAYLVRRSRPVGRDRRLGAAILCVAALVGSLWHLCYTAMFYSPAAQLMGERGEYRAVVRDYSRQYDYGSSVTVELDGVGANARVRLWIPHPVDLHPGDRIVFEGRLDAPDTTPEFDFFNYYRSQRIFLDGEATEVIAVDVANHTPLRFIPAAIRHSLGDRFDDMYSGDANAIVRALCIGDRTYMSKSLRLAVRGGGLSHLLAISGLHVTMLCGAMVAGFRNRRRKNLAASFIALAGVLLFIMVCGAPPSAVRAFVMHGMMLLAVAVRRDDDPLSALGLSLLVLLAANPYSINDIGLQLSFLATFGLLVHFGGVRGWVSKHMTARVFNRLPKLLRRALQAVVDAVIITLVANLYTAPLIAYHFGSLPLYGTVANLPALVLTPVSLVGGLLSGVVSLVLPSVGRVIAAMVAPFCSALSGISYFFARLPFSLIDMSSAYNICALILAYTLIIIWYVTPSRPHGRLCAAASVAAFVIAFAFGELDRRTDAAEVVALDVGQGQSILLLSGDSAALIDVGGSCYDGAGCRAAEALMLAGRRHVDALVLTHYHSDHANGVDDLLRFVTVDNVYGPPPDDSDAPEGVDIRYVDSEDEVLDLGGMTLTILRPVQRSVENEHGVAVLASAGSFDLLVTGDLGEVSEHILLERSRLNNIEVLAVGHHGSRSSTSDLLLDRTSPQAAIISVGINNYGHPTAETLGRLEAHGCGIYRTDLGGDVTVRVAKEAKHGGK